MNKKNIKISLAISFGIFVVIGFIARIQHVNTQKEWLDGLVSLTVGLNTLILSVLVMMKTLAKLRIKKPIPILEAIFYLFLGLILICVSVFISYQGLSKLLILF